MNQQALTDYQYEAIAERFRLLGEPMRLRILMALRQGELTVTDLVNATGGNQANISRHLNTLRTSAVVSRRKEGTWVYYSIADESVFDLCALVCKGNPNLVKLESYFTR
jgi:DNA-binding transcriptional ArsR family regulator